MSILDTVTAALDSAKAETGAASDEGWVSFDPEGLQALVDVYRRRPEAVLETVEEHVGTLLTAAGARDETERDAMFHRARVCLYLVQRLKASRDRTYSDGEGGLERQADRPRAIGLYDLSEDDRPRPAS